jgi:hypothetical protein
MLVVRFANAIELLELLLFSFETTPFSVSGTYNVSSLLTAVLRIAADCLGVRLLISFPALLVSARLWQPLFLPRMGSSGAWCCLELTRVVL